MAASALGAATFLLRDDINADESSCFRSPSFNLAMALHSFSD
jgi:hypothetical protein